MQGDRESQSPLLAGPAIEHAVGPSLPLLVWLSPAFPVGSFAYSHGLEQAVQAGEIIGLESARLWLEDLIASGGPRNDAILLAAAWRAGRSANDPAVREINALALALASSKERYLETSTQGNGFMSAVAAAWACPGLMSMRAGLDGDVAYPVAVGIAAAAHGIALTATLEAYLVATTTSLASALVRLAVIGQTDGQRLIASLTTALAALARYASTATLDDIGGAAFGSDLAAIAHETQETRMFRS